jgi:hypothetical protein
LFGEVALEPPGDDDEPIVQRFFRPGIGCRLARL